MNSNAARFCCYQPHYVKTFCKVHDFSSHVLHDDIFSSLCIFSACPVLNEEKINLYRALDISSICIALSFHPMFFIIGYAQRLCFMTGPQDHGWCFGYTCQKRISTFYAIVATNTNFDIFFTGSVPEILRFHLLNVDDTTAGVRIAVW